jgi:hypothetical protein
MALTASPATASATVAFQALPPCDPSAYPPATSFSFGTWPPSCWRPYSDTSAVNLPLPFTLPAVPSTEPDETASDVLHAYQRDNFMQRHQATHAKLMVQSHPG